MKTEVDGKQYYTFSGPLVKTICIAFPVAYSLFLIFRHMDWMFLSMIAVIIAMILVFAMAYSWYLSSNLNAAITQFKLMNEYEIQKQRQYLLEKEFEIRRKHLQRELDMIIEEDDILQ